MRCGRQLRLPDHRAAGRAPQGQAPPSSEYWPWALERAGVGALVEDGVPRVDTPSEQERPGHALSLSREPSTADTFTLTVDGTWDRSAGQSSFGGTKPSSPEACAPPSSGSGGVCPWPVALYRSTQGHSPGPWSPIRKQLLEPVGQVRG